MLKDMMNGYPDYKKCLNACLACAASCNHCAASCLQDKDVQMMTACIELDMECAVICYASAQLMSLGSDRAKSVCALCAEICRACAEECEKHQNEHCQECARLCTTCAELCESM
jgi:hypothetical protein